MLKITARFDFRAGIGIVETTTKQSHSISNEKCSHNRDISQATKEQRPRGAAISRMTRVYAILVYVNTNDQQDSTSGTEVHGNKLQSSSGVVNGGDDTVEPRVLLRLIYSNQRSLLCRTATAGQLQVG